LHRVAVLSLGLSLLAAPGVARANTGPKWWGDASGDPTGLRDVAIVREELKIDLRPIQNLRPAEVDVVYRIHNSGAARKLDLVFASGALDISDFQLWLNGASVEDVHPLPAQRRWDMPKSWRLPDDRKGFDGTSIGRLRWEHESYPLEIHLSLPEGPSTLRATYRSRAAGMVESKVTATWEFAYVLAPAREWGEFGGLDVTVQIPHEWEFRSDPELSREGDVLRGSFPELPADCLSVSIRANRDREYQAALRSSIYGSLAALVVGAWLCWAVGRWLLRPWVTAGSGSETAVRSEARQWLLVCAAFGCGAALGALAWLLTHWAVDAIWGSLAGQENPYFHERFFALPCCLLPAMPLCWILGFCFTYLGAKGARQFF
jgi:hypothetical protein